MLTTSRERDPSFKSILLPLHVSNLRQPPGVSAAGPGLTTAYSFNQKGLRHGSSSRTLNNASDHKKSIALAEFEKFARLTVPMPPAYVSIWQY